MSDVKLTSMNRRAYRSTASANPAGAQTYSRRHALASAPPDGEIGNLSETCQPQGEVS
jgi:hypothetical protein